MRNYLYENRTYRNLFKGRNLVYFTVSTEETDLQIGAHKKLETRSLEIVSKYRNQIKEYISENRCFNKALSPMNYKTGSPAIIQQMCKASVKTGVGPMAAVAGALSEFTGRELLNYSKEIIVENGGDIFISTHITRIIGIYAGNSPLSNKIGIKLLPEDTPLGVCTSSGKIGHSLSFGYADAVVVLSPDTALSDAAATAAGNLVKTPDDINTGLKFLQDINSVSGAVIVVDDKLGAWGKISLVKL